MAELMHNQATRCSGWADILYARDASQALKQVGCQRCWARRGCGLVVVIVVVVGRIRFT
jgi:hypothetical protein